HGRSRPACPLRLGGPPVLVSLLDRKDTWGADGSMGISCAITWTSSSSILLPMHGPKNVTSEGCDVPTLTPSVLADPDFSVRDSITTWSSGTSGTIHPVGISGHSDRTYPWVRQELSATS